MRERRKISDSQPQLFDPVAFGMSIGAEIKRRDISERKAARQANIDAATFNRMVRGHAPSVETYLRTLWWLRTS